MDNPPALDLQNGWEPLDEQALRQVLSDCTELAIDVALPSIGYTNSYLDICDELREAAYVCEYLSNNFECSSAERIFEVRNDRFRVHIRNFDPAQLAEALLDIQWALKPSTDYDDGAASERHRDAIDRFEDSLHTTPLHHPHIVDDFFANKVGGAYYEIPASLAFDANKHPERALGFWKSPYFSDCSEPPYNSMHSTIVPKAIGIEEALKRVGGPSEIYLLHAELLIDQRSARFLSEGFNLVARSPNVHRGISCTNLMDLSQELYEFQDIISVRASELKDFAVVETDDYWIVIHDVAEESGESYGKVLANIAEKIRGETFIDDSFEIDWRKVDDEVFEEICYDIIYQSATFDRSTICKMGKSRSRDGGRDITVSTNASGRSPRKKYIFQCKALSPDRALTTSTLGYVSEVIEQYGADGYGVLTTGLIDATVYDRLSAITDRRSVELRTFSRMEIERFLARRPALLEKYRNRVAKRGQ